MLFCFSLLSPKQTQSRGEAERGWVKYHITDIGKMIEIGSCVC